MRKKAKSPLLSRLINTYQEALESTDSVLEGHRRSRRNAIKKIGIAGLGISFYLSLESCGLPGNKENNKSKVAIIGAGIAGLHAAYILKKANVEFELFEASGRSGGRIYSKKGVIGDSLVTELGGEFIDSDHEDILNLCKEFGLELMDCETDVTANSLIKDAYHFEGRLIPESDVIAEFTKYIEELSKDISHYENEDEEEMTRLDNLSISQYLDQLGVSGWFRTLLDMAFTSEFGLEVGEQSALNLLCMLSVDTSDGFKVFGNSDERYKVIGGNQRLIDAMADKIKDKLRLEYELAVIRKSGNGFELEFKNGTRKECEYLLLTLPFNILRNIKIEVDLPAEKKQVIDELGYGTSSKILLGVKNRGWRKAGYCGYLFNESIQNGWDNSQLQNNNEGEAGFTVFLGGKPGASVNSDSCSEYFETLKSIFPDIESNDHWSVFNWSTHPFTKAGYSCYKMGQWMSLAGKESVPVGNIHFAGEHCSENFQGYMNGGAETGRVAATTIIQAIKDSEANSEAKPAPLGQ